MPYDTDKKAVCLRDRGFIVGPRDPRVNTAFPGAFMVCEEPEDDADPWPTEDGSASPWAIVGDDLSALVEEAYATWEADHDAYKPDDAA